MNKWFVCVVLLLFIGFRALAQDTQSATTQIISDIFEQYTAESEESIDYETFYENLIFLSKHKVNLNNCSKEDLAGGTPLREDGPDGVAIALSAKSGAGIDLLHDELLAVAGWHQSEDVFIARERHLRALAAARRHIEAARGIAAGPRPALELLAEELRLGQQALNEITGEFTADDLLGVIFSRFCIGK